MNWILDLHQKKPTAADYRNRYRGQFSDLARLGRVFALKWYRKNLKASTGCFRGGVPGSSSWERE